MRLGMRTWRKARVIESCWPCATTALSNGDDEGWTLEHGELGSATSSLDWARLLEPSELSVGDVLLGAPSGFLGEGSGVGPERVGMKYRFPENWGALSILQQLPVVLITYIGCSGSAEGLLLNVRTGQLMGDFIPQFHSCPLYVGGPNTARVSMIHSYQQVPGSQLLSEEAGLYLGGDFADAQALVDDGEVSILRFRFFVNNITWSPGELNKELDGANGQPIWMPVRCAADLLLPGIDGDKPLWAQVAELAGGAALEAGRQSGLLC